MTVMRETRRLDERSAYRSIRRPERGRSRPSSRPARLRWPPVAHGLLLLGLACLPALAAGPAAATAPQAGSDWNHALKVLLNMRSRPPRDPLVFLLGDSLARESTVSDRSWSNAVRHYGEANVAVYNLGSRNQTFDHSAALVTLMPARPAIVFISVDPGRFASGRTTPITSLDAELAAKHWQHHYKDADIMSWGRKQAMLRAWVQRSYPVFRARYLANLLRLDALLTTCERRHVHAVLLDLPMNMQLIGSTMDVPIETYRDGCKSLAALHGVPYVNLAGRAQLTNEDFYDIAHMVGSGRVKFQKLLAQKTVALLRQHGMR
jgi:hypothetical protein